MRAIRPAVFLIVVGLLTVVGNAQVFQLPTPVPQVTAANADWQIRGDAIFFAGDFYYPTGPTVFFDGNVMVRTGIYQGTPLYADSTLEPYSMVFVPIGRNVMRPYERRRTGTLAGTTGSHPPSFPIEKNGERDLAAFAGVEIPPPPGAEPGVVPESARPVGTTGIIATRVAPAASPVVPRATTRNYIESIPRPRSTAGIWLQYNGTRWYSAGAAVPYANSQFTQVGSYRGFPVYEKRGGSAREIYIPSVQGGLLAPYQRR